MSSSKQVSNQATHFPKLLILGCRVASHPPCAAAPWTRTCRITSLDFAAIKQTSRFRAQDKAERIIWKSVDVGNAAQNPTASSQSHTSVFSARNKLCGATFLYFLISSFSTVTSRYIHLKLFPSNKDYKEFTLFSAWREIKH